MSPLALYLTIAFFSGAIATTIATNRNVPEPFAYFFLGAILPVVGIIAAAVVRPGPPAGMRAVICPTCNAPQNIDAAVREWSCWQCKSVWQLPGRTAPQR